MAAFTIQRWLPSAHKSFGVDLVAGTTLWALLVPQSIAYAKLAGAPNLAAGLYCIIIVLPIYALFASSRLLVASPTTAVSATFAGFLASMAASPEAAIPALVVGTSIAYLLFAYFKLGFLTYFISKPVSAGYMTGLSIVVLIGQASTLLGIDGVDGSTWDKLKALALSLPDANSATTVLSAAFLLLLIGLPKISHKIPAGLVTIAIAIGVSVALQAEKTYGVAMVGALPSNLPSPTLPLVGLADLTVIIPASIGLVILASGEASVTAQTMAAQSGRLVNFDRQFLAFGMGNLVGGLFGAVLGTGASSASMVNANAGARTLASTLWAALGALLTLLYLSDIFAYLPNAFLAALVATAVWNLLLFKQIWKIREFATGEFVLALLAMIGVLTMGILNGLLIAMIINVLYSAYVSAHVIVGELGTSIGDKNVLLPKRHGDTDPLPDDVVALGTVKGQIYYASAPTAFAQSVRIIKSRPDTRAVVLSLARVDRLDYSSRHELQHFVQLVTGMGKHVWLTDVHSPALMEQLLAMELPEESVTVTALWDGESAVTSLGGIAHAEITGDSKENNSKTGAGHSRDDGR